MTKPYWEATGPLEIIQRYMKYHPELIGANIACIFKEKASKSDGRPIVGKVSKVPLRYHAIMPTPHDYLIEIGMDVWQELSDSTREAWVDFLLEQCYGEENKEGDIIWKLRKPELVGFTSIIGRHGLGWNDGLSKLQSMDFSKAGSVAPTKRATEEDEEDADVPSNIVNFS